MIFFKEWPVTPAHQLVSGNMHHDYFFQQLAELHFRATGFIWLSDI
jgi:hypothetical protein